MHLGATAIIQMVEFKPRDTVFEFEVQFEIKWSSCAVSGRGLDQNSSHNHAIHPGADRPHSTSWMCCPSGKRAMLETERQRGFEKSRERRQGN
jgi:hypothetical protein